MNRKTRYHYHSYIFSSYDALQNFFRARRYSDICYFIIIHLFIYIAGSKVSTTIAKDYLVMKRKGIFIEYLMLTMIIHFWFINSFSTQTKNSGQCYVTLIINCFSKYCISARVELLKSCAYFYVHHLIALTNTPCAHHLTTVRKMFNCIRFSWLL